MRRLQIKFPNQIRISGWDFGSSARAMNQAGGYISTQADLRTVRGSTTERKSMSTKTTMKRIALVAVSALGLGLVSSVAPASAAVSTGITLNTSSITVVGNNSDSSTARALVAITVAGDTNTGLQAGETITATVIGVPTSVTTTKTLASNKTDLAFLETKGQTSNVDIDWTAFTADTWVGVGSSTDGQITSLNTKYVGLDHLSTDTATTLSRTYTMGILGVANYLDQGVYTIAFDLKDSSGSIISRQTLKIDFVSSAETSGAILTAAAKGTWFIGDTPTVAEQSTLRYMKATLTNRDGGRIFGAAGAAPTLSALLTDASDPAVNQAMDIADDATNEVGYSATTASRTSYAIDGVYGVKKAAAFTAAKGPATLTVRYGLASSTASVTILTKGSAASGTVKVVAAGQAPVEAVANTTTVPVATKSATVYVSGATAGSPYSYTVTYSNVASGDQSPLASTPTTVYADADGKFSVTVTNANPIDGAYANVAISGFTTNPTTQKILWTKATGVETISVSLNGAYVALKSSNTFTATVTNIFGNPVAGVVLQPKVTKSNADLATAPRATVITDANGQASITVTDAAAVAAGTDVVTFTEVTTGTAKSGFSTITYAAAAPSVTAMTPYYSTTVDAAVDAITTPVPATGIYYNATNATGFDLEDTRKTDAAVTATAGKQLIIKIKAGAAGAAVTAAASKGAYVLSSINYEASSRTKYTDADGYVTFLVGTHAAGANTVTFTSGTVTTSVAFWGADATAPRFVKLSKDGNVVTASITDRYGNGVAGKNIQISSTDGTLGNGQKTTVYTTDTRGSVTFIPVGGVDTTITAYASDTATGYTSLLGYVGTNAVNADLAAGNRSATLAITAAVEGSDAIDAANEATDAANAATDAANAAAEAADAATAAAQDAQAAVAELATKVASLIAGIKAQITTLTNLVIKIQKKVRA